jgi:hypothetical protein
MTPQQYDRITAGRCRSQRLRQRQALSRLGDRLHEYTHRLAQEWLAHAADRVYEPISGRTYCWWWLRRSEHAGWRPCSARFHLSRRQGRSDGAALARRALGPVAPGTRGLADWLLSVMGTDGRLWRPEAGRLPIDHEVVRTDSPSGRAREQLLAGNSFGGARIPWELAPQLLPRAGMAAITAADPGGPWGGRLHCAGLAQCTKDESGCAGAEPPMEGLGRFVGVLLCGRAFTLAWSK